MKLAEIERIASALLYEGHVLYPYRSSALKNRQRWNFGVLCPPVYHDLHPDERSESQTECLVQRARENENPCVQVRLRFLRVIERRVARIHPIASDSSLLTKEQFQFVESLRIGDRVFHSWQEASESEIVLPEIILTEGPPAHTPYSFHINGSETV